MRTAHRLFLCGIYGFCTLIVAAALPTAVPAAPAPGPRLGPCEQALLLARENDHTKAIELYTTCLNTKGLSDVVRGGVLVNRGNSYKRIGRSVQALADFSQAILLDPTNTMAYNNRGNVLRSENRLAEAIEDFTKAIELSPRNTMIYNNRANAYKSMGEYGKAAADMDKAVELNPSNAISYYNRACLESVRKNAAAACEWLDKAVRKGFVEYELMGADKDLENIRGSKCYQRIVEKK